MSLGSFSNLITTAGIILWLVITVGLFQEFETHIAILLSSISLLPVWWVTKSMIPLAYEKWGWKLFIILWLVITAAYVALFDPFVALSFSIFTALAFWSCGLKMIAHHRAGSASTPFC